MKYLRGVLSGQLFVKKYESLIQGILSLKTKTTLKDEINMIYEKELLKQYNLKN